MAPRAAAERGDSPDRADALPGAGIDPSSDRQGVTDNRSRPCFRTPRFRRPTPVERLGAVHNQVTELEASHILEAGEMTTSLERPCSAYGAGPPRVAWRSARIHRFGQVTPQHGDDDVPGPQAPLYCLGHETVGVPTIRPHRPWVPGRHGDPVLQRRLFFGVTGDYETMPDVAVLATATATGIQGSPRSRGPLGLGDRVPGRRAGRGRASPPLPLGHQIAITSAGTLDTEVERDFVIGNYRQGEEMYWGGSPNMNACQGAGPEPDEVQSRQEAASDGGHGPGTDVRIAVVGAGSWGTTVASMLAERFDTVLWALEPEVAEAISAHHQNPTYLAGFTLAGSLSAHHQSTRGARRSPVAGDGGPGPAHAGSGRTARPARRSRRRDTEPDQRDRAGYAVSGPRRSSLRRSLPATALALVSWPVPTSPAR